MAPDIKPGYLWRLPISYEPGYVYGLVTKNRVKPAATGPEAGNNYHVSFFNLATMENVYIILSATSQAYCYIPK